MQSNIENAKVLSLLALQLKMASESIGLALEAERNSSRVEYENNLDTSMMLISSVIESIYSKPAVAALIAASSARNVVTTSDLKPITNDSLPIEPFDKHAHSLKPTINYRRRRDVVPNKFLLAAWRIGQL